jgi:hypothetical protein
MPGLPDRPDLDQLRRQARELLRAASGGEPTAVARIRAVSERMTLAAAQLALAREYGCRNWAALRAEVERRHSPLDRWSFGGAAAIEAPSGMLLPEGLVASADMAVLFTSLTPSEIPSDTASDTASGNGARPDREVVPEQLAGMDEEVRALYAATETGDITVVDDQGVTYTLRTLHRSGASGPFPSSVWFRVEPVPGREIEWLELGGQNGTATRLRPSPRAVVRLGRLTPVTTSPAERQLTRDAPSAMLDAAQERTDAPRHHLDLGITLPLIDGMTFQLDSLVCVPTGWSLFMRARPRWWRYRDDRRRKWSPVEISAEDDRGSSYLYRFGGSSGRNGCEEIRLEFGPRLDPLARRLRLTCTGSSEQIAVDLDLPPGALGRD